MLSDEVLRAEQLCPRCLVGRLKTWNELSEDEKILVESLPAGAVFSRLERRTHFFCTHCWHEAKPSLTLA